MSDRQDVVTLWRLVGEHGRRSGAWATNLLDGYTPRESAEFVPLAALEVVKAERDQLRGALEFYAQLRGYHGTDGGLRARAALGGTG